jgi:hypothetical protein
MPLSGRLKHGCGLFNSQQPAFFFYSLFFLPLGNRRTAFANRLAQSELAQSQFPVVAAQRKLAVILQQMHKHNRLYAVDTPSSPVITIHVDSPVMPLSGLFT